MFLLDADIVSQPIKPKPNSAVSAWLRAHDKSGDTFISVISLFEIAYGAALLPSGKRRTRFETWLHQELHAQFAGHILSVSEDVAAEGGRLYAHAKLAGFQVSFGDALIAATARVHGCFLVTLNRRHFAQLDVQLVDF